MTNFLPVASAAGSSAAVAGAGASGTGMDGIAGLFSALVGGVSGQESAGVSIVNLGQAAGVGANMPQQLQLGDGAALQLVGDDDVIADFMARVQGIYRQLIESGLKIGTGDDVDELAGALTQQGMDPDVAQAVAARIDTLMQLLDQQQEGGLDDDTQTALVAVMMAAMQVPPCACGQPSVAGRDGEASQVVSDASAQAVSVQVTLVSAQVMDVRVVRGGYASAGASATDVLLGDGGRSSEASGAPVSVLAGAADAAAKPEVVVRVARAGEEASDISVVLPGMTDAAQTAAAAAQTAAVQQVAAAAGASAVAAQQSAVERMPVKLDKVAVEKLLEKPKGDVVYTWQSDKLGQETLQAVQPVGDAGNSAAALAQQAQGQGMVPGSVAGGAGGAPLGGTFAERLQALAGTEVAQQVAVQVKPLAQEGGGTVRMVLNPPELGEVRIDLTVTDGKVHGAIAATDAAVVEHLARELHSLRHGLADAGMKLGEQGINLMLSNHGNFGHQQQGQQSHASPNWGGALGSDAEVAEVDLPGSWVAPERVLDVRV